MNQLKQLKVRALTTFAAVMLSGLAPNFGSAEPPAGTAAPTNSAAINAVPSDAPPTAAKTRLTGAELYSIHCNRCHQERYPTERTGAQWKTIMLHMQVRANIPVSQAKLILQYLQDNSGR
jgi:cytochrome c5